jgi:outer membrane lipoprotein carrier protein
LLAFAAARVSGVADVSCGSTKDCLHAIEEAQRETRTLQADFEQVKQVALLEKPLVSRGRLFFKRPDRVRLEVTEPKPAILLIRGSQIEIPGVSEADRESLSMTPAASMFSRLGALFTGATRELEEDFTLSARSDGDAIEVALEPKQERWQKILRRMELRFAGPELLLAAIRIEDPLGDRLRIAMREVRRNVELDESLFEPG